MRTPEFWLNPKRTWPARLLSPLGWIYGAITARRMARQGQLARVPVICIGNFVAGGAGKTPTVLALHAMLRTMGKNPAALARGYGGTLAGPIRVCAKAHSAAEVGDEPLLLASQMPVIIARSRPDGAELAATIGADVILMDDGLQNPSLQKTLRIAVVDGKTGTGNGLCLPAGPLRAPLAAQLSHVDAVIVIGDGLAGQQVAAMARQAGKPVHMARLVPDSAIAETLINRAVLALAGIGRPEKFAATLREIGARVEATRYFDDHHAYTLADMTSVLAQARKECLHVVTTTKDWVKLAPLLSQADMALVVTLPVSLVFDDAEAIRAMVARCIAFSTDDKR